MQPEYTWHCSTQGLPSWYVTTTGCELLPHIFILIHLRRTVIFCGTFFLISRSGPVVSRCVALCWPDFPPLPEAEAIARFIVSKGTQNFKKPHEKSARKTKAKERSVNLFGLWLETDRICVK